MKVKNKIKCVLQGLKVILFCSLLVITTGCSSNFQLVSFSGNLGAGYWEHIIVPREPQGPEEEAVRDAARSRNVVSNGDTTAIFLASDTSQQIISAVTGPGNDTDEMTPKKIKYYLMVNGKIRAYSNPVIGPSPDADYEKTIYSAALRSQSQDGFEVIIYSRPDGNLTVHGLKIGRCVSKVTVRDGFDVAGNILSERIVNVCFDNL